MEDLLDFAKVAPLKVEDLRDVAHGGFVRFGRWADGGRTLSHSRLTWVPLKTKEARYMEDLPRRGPAFRKF